MRLIQGGKKDVKKEEKKVWECECGNASFYLYADSNIECADCGKFHYGAPQYAFRTNFLKRPEHV